MSTRHKVHRPTIDGCGHANHVIAVELERLLRAVHIQHVHVAGCSVPPPALAYVTAFPRLSIPIKGVHAFEVAPADNRTTVTAGRGHAVLVPAHAWDRPLWSRHASLLTCLFGPRQVGFSLVVQKGHADAAPVAIKTSVPGAHDAVSRRLLQALLASTTDSGDDRLRSLLTESLLHACLRLLRNVQPPPRRKAVMTYEAICLYLAEHFQDRDLNRASVAARFGLAPNHVSRLFAVEGAARFNDHLNAVRVNRAKFMLANYRMSIKEIAGDSGYGDAAYFCRVFRKMTGMTPLQYRMGSSASAAHRPAAEDA